MKGGIERDAHGNRTREQELRRNASAENDRRTRVPRYRSTHPNQLHLLVVDLEGWKEAGRRVEGGWKTVTGQ